MPRKYQRQAASRFPPLSVNQILGWADAHRRRTGAWPSRASGEVVGALGEKWANLAEALRVGRRGLLPGSSLARLLAEYRGVRNRKGLPPFTEATILRWADAFRRRTGSWPSRRSGPIPEAPGETWWAVDAALDQGRRGFPGNSSLAQLLAKKRRRRNVRNLSPFTVATILRWADEYHRRTGTWPHERSGPIAQSPDETWLAVDMALRKGLRGLPAGSSLPRLLAQNRGVRNEKDLPRLTMRTIRAWADDHRRQFGRWPRKGSGPVAAAPEERWSAIDTALHKGRRGLPGGSSLAMLFADR